MVAAIAALPTQRRIDTTAGPLLLCHGVADNDLAKIWPGSERMPPERSPTLDCMIERGQFRLLVNGHMHYRVVLDFPGLTLINAGTLLPRHRPGVSLLDFVSNEVRVFEFGAPAGAPAGASAGADSIAMELEESHRVMLFDAARKRWPNSAAFDSSALPLTLYS